MHQEDQEAYVQAVLSLYRRLPDTALRPRPADRRLAAELYRRGVRLDVLEVALRLAAGRRLARPRDAEPLPPIRSLHYFLPVIDELPQAPPPDGYLEYLRETVPDRMTTTPTARPSTVRPTHRPRARPQTSAQLRLPFETGAGPKHDVSS